MRSSLSREIFASLIQPGFSSMPWIEANPLVSSSGIYMRVNSLTSVTVGHQVLGAAGNSFASVHFELRQNLANSQAHLRPPLFDPYLVQWLGPWQLFAGWEIFTEKD